MQGYHSYTYGTLITQIWQATGKAREEGGKLKSVKRKSTAGGNLRS